MLDFLRRKTRGQSILETAVVLPIIVFIFGGIVDFGFAFFISHTIQNAAREGARVAVTLPNLVTDDPRVISEVNDRLPNIGMFAPFNGGISNSPPTGADCDLEVTVTVTGTHEFLLLPLIGVNDIVMSPESTMRYEQCG